MALAETARLATVLTLDDKLTPGLKKPIGSVNAFDSKIGKASKGLGRMGSALKTTGAIAGAAFAGGLVVAIKGGLDDLATLESAVTSVDGAIKTMGLTGKVTGAQIADWANEIEAATDAAFDDKEITAATATLIRYGKVSTKNLKPAMEVMTDLAAKTGDVGSASSLLAKALADPEKAAGKLARQGIILTEAQQKQIKAFMKAGETGKAQAVVLAAIEKSTKGAAKAMNGPYVDAQRKLSDAWEDTKKALAVGFLPVIERISAKLNKLVADPKFMQSVRDFGKGLAGAFDKAVDFAEKIPWGAIGSALQTSAKWAGKLFDAFRSLDPNVQATIIALAGLNKLTGGAPIKIAVDFAKEGLKGLFGQFFERGSPTNPMFVVDVGSKPGGGPGGNKPNGGGGKGGARTGGKAGETSLGEAQGGFKNALKNGLKGGLVLTATAVVVHGDTVKGAPGGAPTDKSFLTTLRTMLAQGRGGESVNSNGETVVQAIDRVTKQIGTSTAGTSLADIRNENRVKSQQIKAAVDKAAADTRSEGNATERAIGGVKAQEQRSLVAFRAGERATLGVKAVTSQKLAAANAKLDAIRHKKTSFRTTVNVRAATSVSVRDINQKTTTSVRFNTRAINQAY